MIPLVPLPIEFDSLDRCRDIPEGKHIIARTLLTRRWARPSRYEGIVTGGEEWSSFHCCSTRLQNVVMSRHATPHHATDRRSPRGQRHSRQSERRCPDPSPKGQNRTPPHTTGTKRSSPHRRWSKLYRLIASVHPLPSEDS
jgi:hypothetical protein